jgi:hypothetical protein
MCATYVQLLSRLPASLPPSDLPGMAADASGRRAWTFTDLLRAVHDVPGIERIRFATSHPRYFTGGTGEGMGRVEGGRERTCVLTAVRVVSCHSPPADRLVRACAELPKLCEFFHIPFQVRLACWCQGCGVWSRVWFRMLSTTVPQWECGAGGCGSTAGWAALLRRPYPSPALPHALSALLAERRQRHPARDEARLHARAVRRVRPPATRTRPALASYAPCVPSSSSVSPARASLTRVYTGPHGKSRGSCPAQPATPPNAPAATAPSWTTSAATCQTPPSAETPSWDSRVGIRIPTHKAAQHQ